MSSVRMCDYMTENGPCGTIFSEKEVGWATGMIATVDEDGKPHTETADFCPAHSPSSAPKNRNYPRINVRAALTNGENNND